MRARTILLALTPGLLSAAVLASGAAEPVRPPLAPISPAVWQPRAGDVIVTAADDVIDAQIRNASGKDAGYSHIGLVVARGDGLAVIEATPFGAGTVAFKSVEAFTTDPGLVDLLVVRPRAPFDAERLSAEATRLADAAVPFDYDLDADDPSKLYCAELVFNLLRHSGVDLTGVRRAPMWIPLTGERDVIPPQAFAIAPQFERVARRTRTN